MLFLIGSGFGFSQFILGAIAFAVAIMMALIFHEWAHAWVAYKNGDNTAKALGRMTLNPKKHIEPLGLLSFVLIGMGWAKPVPTNPFNYRNFRRGNFLVSIAGIVMNFILGVVFSFLFFIMVHYADWHNGMTSLGLWFIGYFFMIGMVINLALMIFNLLPIFPLDGYNILRSFTKPNNRYMQFVRDNTQWLLLVVMLVMIFTGLFDFIRGGIIDLLIAFWSLIFGV